MRDYDQQDAITWDGEFVCVTAYSKGNKGFVSSFQVVEFYLNQAYKKGYELFKIIQREIEGSKEPSKADIFRLIFRKIQIKE